MPLNSLFGLFASVNNVEGASSVPSYQEHLISSMHIHEDLAKKYPMGHEQRRFHNEQARSYQRELLGLPNP